MLIHCKMQRDTSGRDGKEKRNVIKAGTNNQKKKKKNREEEEDAFFLGLFSSASIQDSWDLEMFCNEFKIMN